MRLLACSLTLSFLLAACGGGGSTPAPTPVEDPLQPYRSQSLGWAACDPTVLGRNSSEFAPVTTALAERLQCATLRVPLDYGNPARGDAAISVMRVLSADPAQRRGSLFFNPGGPGEDGLGTMLILVKAFSDSDFADPQGALQLRLLAEYDMVGFSPRGTGNSTSLTCTTNELVRPVDYTATGAYTPANFDNPLYNARMAAQACKKNPLTPYIHTEATAQDMDLLRGLLGDAKLNYLGYSYGTWLGAWYASRFPERVGRMVLDSNMDFSADSSEEFYLLLPMARQRMLNEIMAPYASRHPAFFMLGATPQEVKAVVAGLSPRVQSLLGATLSSLGYSRPNTDEYVFSIVAARGLDEVLSGLPGGTYQDIEAALAVKIFVPWSDPANAAVRQLASKLLGGYDRNWLRPQPPQSVVVSPNTATLAAVRCNDTPSTTDPQFWFELGRDQAQSYPLFFATTLPAQVSCLYWSGPVVQKPRVTAMQGMDVMLVQSEYDTATATELGRKFFAALPAAHGVYVPGEYTHGVYPYNDRCVDPAVTRYLLGDSPSARLTTCPAIPLPQDQLAATPRLRTVPSITAGSAYKNPEKALALIERFKKGIGRDQDPTP